MITFKTKSPRRRVYEHLADSANLQGVTRVYPYMAAALIGMPQKEVIYHLRRLAADRLIKRHTNPSEGYNTLLASSIEDRPYHD